MLTYNIDLDVTPGTIPAVVHVKQYQTDAVLDFKLFSRRGSLSIGTVTNCSIRGTKADGNGISKTASYSSGTKTVSVQLEEQMTAVAGRQPFEITLTDSTGKMITATFYLDVQRAALDKATISNSVIMELVDALDHTNEIISAYRSATNILNAQDGFVFEDVGDYIPNFFAYGINPNTGADLESANRIRSNFIPILPGRIFKITAENTAKFKVAFYSSDAVSTYTGIEADWTKSYYVKNSGATTYYIRILVGYENDSNVSSIDSLASLITMDRYEYRKYLELDERLSTEDVNEFFFDKGYYVPTFVLSGINPNNGRDIESTNRIRSNYIPVLPGRILKVETEEIAKFKVAYFDDDDVTTFTSIESNWLKSKYVKNEGTTTIYIRILVGYENDSDVSSVNALAAYVTVTRYIKDNPAEIFETIYIHNTDGAYWNVETNTAVFTTIEAVFLASAPISVKAGEKYELTARQGTTNKARIWVVTDDSYNIVEMCENFNGVDEHTVQFTIPSGGTKLLLTKQARSSTQQLKRIIPVDEYITKSLKKKKLSLLGDSISAYSGTIPSGNDAYYSGSNSGVSSPDQMWWSILCDKTGMEPLVIDGWSGAGITQLEDADHVAKVPMSSDARCSRLGSGTTTPDIILIAGGVNDYTYALSEQSAPLPWDCTVAPVLSNSFTEAYACMIKKLQTNYPKAIIVCLSTWFTMRGDDNGYTLTHTVGSHTYTQADYNEAIRYVAEHMHVPYIDVSNIGFNRNNFYPEYAQDSATIPTHPNANGHYIMGTAIADKLEDEVRAYLNQLP